MDLQQDVNGESEISSTGEMWQSLLWTFGVSCFCAMVYAVLWTRILTAFLGNSAYAFSVMLTACLLGIAVGSFLFAAIARRVKQFLTFSDWFRLELGYPLLC